VNSSQGGGSKDTWVLREAANGSESRHGGLHSANRPARQWAV
jgi:uncharacterized circularly permuted ATP-grasp superfamily protein